MFEIKQVFFLMKIVNREKCSHQGFNLCPKIGHVSSAARNGQEESVYVTNFCIKKNRTSVVVENVPKNIFQHYLYLVAQNVSSVVPL